MVVPNILQQSKKNYIQEECFNSVNHILIKQKKPNKKLKMETKNAKQISSKKNQKHYFDLINQTTHL